MNQEIAKGLFFEGGIFIFLDVPEGTEFGIDLKSWNTGQNFRGVKMIPSGVHYIFYSSISTTGDVAPRSGFFYNFKKGEVLVKKWDKVTEDISTIDVEENEIVGFKDNITVLDKFLGPYPYDIAKRWRSLTSHMTDHLIKKLMPVCGTVRSALELISCGDSERPRGTESQYISPPSNKRGKIPKLFNCDEALDNLLPRLKPKPGTELRFTLLPEKLYPEGSTPSEITKHCLDSSFMLDTFLGDYSEDMEMIGEIEFAYICFLVGHSFEAFEHWKKIVGLLCSCESAIKRHRSLYDAFVSLLEVQIMEVPEEFLADIVSNNNFVYVKLRELFRAVSSCDVDGQLKTKMQRFQEGLTDTFGWDFTHLESDDEEDAPVIVEV